MCLNHYITHQETKNTVIYKYKNTCTFHPVGRWSTVMRSMIPSSSQWWSCSGVSSLTMTLPQPPCPGQFLDRDFTSTSVSRSVPWPWHHLNLCVQRWKSQRKKNHRLAYRFSIDFKIYRLAYGFLCVNHKGLAKVYRFLVRAFFFRILKIHRLVWIFLWIFCCYGSVSSMFHFDFYKYSLYWMLSCPPLPLHLYFVLWYNVSYRSST